MFQFFIVDNHKKLGWASRLLWRCNRNIEPDLFLLAISVIDLAKLHGLTEYKHAHPENSKINANFSTIQSINGICNWGNCISIFS